MKNALKQGTARGAGRRGREPLVALGLALLLVGGCARYEYRLVEPSQFAQPIGKKQEARLDLPPLSYRLIEQERRLIIAVNNTTDKPLMVVGPKSYVVDPRGETRPLHGGTIAPHSHVRLVLPPQPPSYAASPTFGFGMGYGFGRPSWGPHFGGGWGLGYDPFYSPGPYEVTPVNLPGYWEWRTGEVRLHMVYDQPGMEPVEQEFLFERRRTR